MMLPRIKRVIAQHLQRSRVIIAISGVSSIRPRQGRKRWAICGAWLSRMTRLRRSNGKMCQGSLPRKETVRSAKPLTCLGRKGTRRHTCRVLFRKLNGSPTPTTWPTRASMNQALIQQSCASRKSLIWPMRQRACSPRWLWSSFLMAISQWTCLVCPTLRAQTRGTSSATLWKLATNPSRMTQLSNKLCRESWLRAIRAHSASPSVMSQSTRMMGHSWTLNTGAGQRLTIMEWRLPTSSSLTVRNTSCTRESSTLTASKSRGSTNLSVLNRARPSTKCMRWRPQSNLVAITSRLLTSSWRLNLWRVGGQTLPCTSVMSAWIMTTRTGPEAGEKITRTLSFLGKIPGARKFQRMSGRRKTTRQKSSTLHRCLSLDAHSLGSSSEPEKPLWKLFAWTLINSIQVKY